MEAVDCESSGSWRQWTVEAVNRLDQAVAHEVQHQVMAREAQRQVIRAGKHGRLGPNRSNLGRYPRQVRPQQVRPR